MRLVPLLQILVMDGVDVGRTYAMSWRFAVDVISVVPFIYLVRRRLLGGNGRQCLPWGCLL